MEQGAVMEESSIHKLLESTSPLSRLPFKGGHVLAPPSKMSLIEGSMFVDVHVVVEFFRPL